MGFIKYLYSCSEKYSYSVNQSPNNTAHIFTLKACEMQHFSTVSGFLEGHEKQPDSTSLSFIVHLEFSMCMNVHHITGESKVGSLVWILQVWSCRLGPWKDLSDGIPGILTEPIWELHLVLHYQVSSTIRPLGIGQSFPTDPSLHPWLHNVCCWHSDCSAFQCGCVDCGATQGLMG